MLFRENQIREHMENMSLDSMDLNSQGEGEGQDV
jgi:hypothetical protein